MGSDVKKAYGAAGRDELLWFEPESLVIVKDEGNVLYDERKDFAIDEALVQSIMVYGVLEPVIVRKNGEKPDGTPNVELVDGRQRVLNAIEANRRLIAAKKHPVRIPAIRKHGDDATMFGVMVTTEIRKQSDIMMRARKIGRFMAMGRTKEEAAIAFGVSQATIKNSLSLLDCAPEVQKEVEAGTMSVKVAKELFAVPKEEQAAFVEKLREDGKLVGGAAVEAAAAVRGPKRGKQRVRTLRKIKEIEEMRDKVRSEDAKSALTWALGERKTLPL